MNKIEDNYYFNLRTGEVKLRSEWTALNVNCDNTLYMVLCRPFELSDGTTVWI